MVERTQAADARPGRWGVVFGSDASLPAARAEIDRATKRGINGGAIYLRNGYYAGIAVVEDRERAYEYLLIAKKFRPDAYVTPMASWCKDIQAKEGFVECANTK